MEVEVEFYSDVAFYDYKMMLFTWKKPLKEGSVVDVFDTLNVDMKEMRTRHKHLLIQEECCIIYHLIIFSYEYNVDIIENRRIRTK